MLGAVYCSDMPEWTHIDLTSRTFDRFGAHSMGRSTKGDGRAPIASVPWLLLTAVCVAAGASKTRLCTDLPPGPQTNVSKMDMDTSWAREPACGSSATMAFA